MGRFLQGTSQVLGAKRHNKRLQLVVPFLLIFTIDHFAKFILSMQENDPQMFHVLYLNQSKSAAIAFPVKS